MDHAILDRADCAVIGAGSAGCFLAARLSGDPAVRVVLVEAGGSDASRVTSIPVVDANAFGNPNDAWWHATDPGAGLGGSNAINGLARVRGLGNDADDLEAGGYAAGRGSKDVKPCFVKLETSNPGGAERKTEGPVEADSNHGWHEPCRRIAEAAAQIGAPTVSDDTMQSPGIARAKRNVSPGRTVGTAAAYPRPARNLHIVAKRSAARHIDHEIAPRAEGESDPARPDVAHAQGTSGAHPAATCRLGADKSDVFDAELRIRGVRRLPVSDASIMADIVSANTNAPTLMIAEKGADLIRRRLKVD